jgi:hypothetical protein
MKVSIMYLLVFVMTLGACTKEEINPIASIKYGTTVTSNDGLLVTFVDIISESRCPENLVCITEGLVEVQIKIENLRGSKTFNLTKRAGYDYLAEGNFNGRRVYLENVNPYPKNEDEIEKSQYTISLIID